MEARTTVCPSYAFRLLVRQKMQALDLTFLGPLNCSYYAEEMERSIIARPGCVVGMVQVARGIWESVHESGHR